eukprot:852011-Alexandrium_andersonii.AAC.1
MLLLLRQLSARPPSLRAPIQALELRVMVILSLWAPRAAPAHPRAACRCSPTPSARPMVLLLL